MRRLAACLLLLSGCGQAPDLPPAAPLDASPAALQQIPHLAPGPHAVEQHDVADWSVAGRDLRLRITAPAGAGPWPLLVFSHGFASDTDQYDALLTHWASHGYLSIAPAHYDSGGTLRAIAMSLWHGKDGLIEGRVDDLRLILAHLDALDDALPGLSARIDRSRIAAAGHSFGAFSAQQLGGAVAIYPESGTRIEGHDPRVKAVVAVSPPGEMFGWINARSWRTMQTPMLATTGTWDVDGHFVTDWPPHRLSFHTAPAEPRWLLVIQGADHCLGSRICRTDRGQAPQHDALRMLNATTVSFLDAQLLDDASAADYLDSGNLARLTNGFAALTAGQD